MNKQVRKVLYAIVAVIVVSSCAVHSEVYIADAERDSAMDIINDYMSTIHVGDNLYIYVYSQTPEAVIPFNQETDMRNTYGAFSKYKGRPYIHGYDVDEAGDIVFPILGKINTTNLTEENLAQEIERQLKEKGYVLDPVVRVKLNNFRVAVLGEVKRPQELHVEGERLTIFEALAKCGDITMWGQRTNVVVLRSREGKVVPVEIDLTQKTMFDSEVYYLQSNDIVYVEPNKKYKKVSYRDPQVPQYLSLSVSVLRLLYRTDRRFF